MTLNCLIVDDEPIAQQIIESYIKDLPNLNLVKKCNNAFEAMQALQSEEVDLMFLDINMPKLSGLGLLKSLSDPPKVIITSAYQEYALEGFELSVADYLLKPFSLERFLQAITKVMNSLSKDTAAAAPAPVPKQTIIYNQGNTGEEYLFIKSDKRIVKVDYKNILFLEGYGNYVKVHTSKEMLLSNQSLTYFDDLLPDPLFVRTHKSYMVAVQHIDSLEGNIVQIGPHQIPIGKFYKKELLERLKVR